MFTVLSRISVVAVVSLALVFGLASGASAGAGAGEGPPGQIPVTPSVQAHLKIKVKQGNLMAKINGRCGPVAGNETSTAKFKIKDVPIPLGITVAEFQAADAAALAAQFVDGLLLDLTGHPDIGTPSDPSPCLDNPFAAPLFLIYGHKVIVKTNKVAVLDVVIMNLAPSFP